MPPADASPRDPGAPTVSAGEVHEEASKKAADSSTIDHIARVGVIVYGLVHLLVAWVVLRLGAGDDDGSASGSGAFRELASTTPGKVALLGVAVGFGALMAWQAVEAAFGYRHRDRRARLVNRLLAGCRLMIYAVIAVNVAMIAVGASSGSGGTDGPTAWLMRLPAGPVIVGGVGVVIVVIGGCLAHFGLSGAFLDTMGEAGEAGASGTAYTLLGKIGYLAKGIAIALIGLLFGYAAVTQDADKSGGLDQALHEVLQTPVGHPAVFILAAGLACFGLYCFALARHLDR